MHVCTGKGSSINEREECMTDPNRAKDFVERTGCDSLAINIGTAHGFYKGTPVIDFKRLEKIKKIIKIPLVLHGGSGVPNSEIRLAIKKGIRKINIDTELRWSFVKAIHEYINTHGLLKLNKNSLKEIDWKISIISPRVSERNTICQRPTLILFS